MPGESRSHVAVGRFDELGQRVGVHLAPGAQLHVSPALARALEQVTRIVQQRSKEESDVDVILEHAHIAKRGIADAGGRTTVVHQLAHVGAALAHALERHGRERPKKITLPAQPEIDRRIAFDRSRKPENVTHDSGGFYCDAAGRRTAYNSREPDPMTLEIIMVPILAAALSANRTEDVSGIWDVVAKFSVTGGAGDGQSTDMKAVLELAQKGKALTGTFTPYEADGKTAQPPLPIADGRTAGATLTFTVKNAAGSSLKFALVLANGRLQGEATPNKDVAGGKLTIKVEATRRPGFLSK